MCCIDLADSENWSTHYSQGKFIFYFQEFISALLAYPGFELWMKLLTIASSSWSSTTSWLGCNQTQKHLLAEYLVTAASTKPCDELAWQVLNWTALVRDIFLVFHLIQHCSLVIFLYTFVWYIYSHGNVLQTTDIRMIGQFLCSAQYVVFETTK